MNVSILKGLLVVVLLGTLSACMMPEPIKKEQALFESEVMNNPSLSHHLFKVDDDTLHYAAAGDPQKPAMVIIHGTPGSWQQYSRYILEERLLEHYYMLVIDRPGWGGSTLGGEQSHASFEEQSIIIGALAKALKEQSGGKPVVLAGHSLGSSIAPRVAMDYPELIDGLLLFAGTLDPALGDPRWFNYVASIPGMGYLVGSSMMRANKEVHDLKGNLERMLPLWEGLQAQTTVVQGMSDKLVYPANIDFAETVLNPENSRIIRLKDEGHLFPMTMRDEVMSWALELLERINNLDKSA